LRFLPSKFTIADIALRAVNKPFRSDVVVLVDWRSEDATLRDRNEVQRYTYAMLIYIYHVRDTEIIASAVKHFVGAEID